MIKHISKLIFTLVMYELGKWIGRELYYKLTANDEVEVPKDFYHKNDQIDIESYIRKDDKF